MVGGQRQSVSEKVHMVGGVCEFLHIQEGFSGVVGRKMLIRSHEA
jgi:hypothetical protein